jgi:formylglycine-generating enzyme required for sulfatase activity
MLLPILLAVAGCQLFSGGGSRQAAPKRAKSACPSPADPALLGIAPELRNDVLDAARAGVVVVRYRTDGCIAELAVEPDCKLRAAYAYHSDGTRRSAVIHDDVELFETLPLRPDALIRALHQYGGLRVDEEIVGRLEAPGALEPDRRALSGDCDEATHVAITIELGGASLVAGSMPTIGTERNWFLRPAQTKTNPTPLQYLGRVSVCRKAQKLGKRTPGCDHPLRVRLLPISEPVRQAPPPPEAEPETVETPRPGPPEDMAAIRAGEFPMGNAALKYGDGPQHAVQLGAFEIDRTEVTVGAYASCVAAGACTPAATGRFCNAAVEGRGDHPINCITWKQAEAYCAFVKKRLPTEAEWERAARGVEPRRFVWGDDWPPPKGSGNFGDRTMQQGEPEWIAIPGYDDEHRHTAPVGSMAKNGEGLSDMAGNVQEWVADWYDPKAYRRRKAVDPKGPTSGKARVVRGGSFGHAAPEALEVTRRAYYLEDHESAHIGFRCAR